MTVSSPSAPWTRLPGQLAGVVAPELDRLQAEILRLIDAEPVWADRMDDGTVRSDLVRATRTVLDRFVHLIGSPEPSLTDPDRAFFRELGAGEAREGRGLEDLLAAYRIGTRVLYTEVAWALAGLDASPDAQVALGEAVFALGDALQSESAAGYALEASTHAGERERHLRRLADALFSGDDDAVRALAHQVGWTLPAAVAVALLPSDHVADARAALGPRGFVVERAGLGVAVLEAGRDLEPTVLGLARAIPAQIRIGPRVPVDEAGRSLVCAQLLPEHQGGGAVWAIDRLATLLTLGAPEVADTIRERVLAPLAPLRPAQRERLTVTLASWLRHWGQRQAVATELAIHPQTVAYRVNQLRDLLGDDLEDPGWRLEAQLALLDATPVAR